MQMKCKVCGKPATKKCSKCKMVWYCSRECQVKDWADHKKVCKTYQAYYQNAQNQARLPVMKKTPDFVEGFGVSDLIKNLNMSSTSENTENLPDSRPIEQTDKIAKMVEEANKIENEKKE